MLISEELKTPAVLLSGVACAMLGAGAQVTFMGGGRVSGVSVVVHALTSAIAKEKTKNNVESFSTCVQKYDKSPCRREFFAHTGVSESD